MISLNSSRQICILESSLKVPQNYYSKSFSRIDFTWLKSENGFRRNINACFKKYPRLSASTTRNLIEEHSAKILESLARQLQFIAAFRIRRTFQLVNVYKKWWGSLIDSCTARQFMNDVSQKRLYFIACLAPLFEWSERRIPSQELSSLLNELYQVRKLAQNQSNYPTSLPSSTEEDSSVAKSDCKCIRCQHAMDEDWDMFYESKSVRIWRKEHQNYPGQGLYVYKVYGHYEDVTANDYFRVQIDSQYRKEWDPNVVELKIIDSDSNTNSDILYWEFLFPRMFHNRDYVFNRRYEINDNKQYIAIVNESVDHPACPDKPPVHRVREYWSHTVIRPTNGSFDEPGIEFTITYFDNPELLIPHYVSVWYTVSGMPDYIKKQKEAAEKLAIRRKQLEKIRENAARDESRLVVLMKDPEWAGTKETGPPKRVMLY